MAEADPIRDELIQKNEALRCHYTHEFNNIRAVALVNTDLLQKRFTSGSPLLEIVDDLGRFLKQARALIQEVRMSGPGREG